MPKDKTITVYTFEELSEDAKDIARQWWREGSCHDDWWENTYEDAARVYLKIANFDIDRGTIKGHLTSTFRESLKAVHKEHGEKTATFKLAHSYFLKIEKLRAKYLDEETDYDQSDEYEELLKQYTKDLLEEYLSLLRKEYEYINSDEYVDEAIIGNEYEFHETGVIA